MDQNSPEDIFTLGEYLGREQYGDRPLFYGQAYTSQVKLERQGDRCIPVSSKGAPVYQRTEKKSASEKDSYFVVRTKDDYQYAQNMIFPRMYSSQHAQGYEDWMGGVEGTEVPYDRCGEDVYVKMPSQIDNIRFFLSYQCNFMYWRYFMWNFVGRQNDLQGNGELEHGNWITGIAPIDNLMLGDQSKLPDDLKMNKGHNVFYGLPLLLGLIGLFWQAYRGQRGIRQFWVVFFLFFMTGLAIVIYLNQTPMQPRERDYAYAGSFYAFAIWCGIGVAAIIDLLKRLRLNGTVVAAAVSLLCLLVPIQMASQTWDDHDRSGRYTCRDFGRNYLMTLQDAGHPIIFTNGDNDTFPLWYNQEVEGVRTDARVCNLSYLQTDWYIDQMKRPAYRSPALPISWTRLQYVAGTNEAVPIEAGLKTQVMEYYRTNPEEARKQFGDSPFELKNILKYWVLNPSNSDMRVIPTDTVYVTIDKNAVKRSGMMMPGDSIPHRMVISLTGKNALYKSDLMMLDIIANAGWTRPIYVASTVGSENFMNLGDNFIQEGLANRITPFTTNDSTMSSFDTEKVYHNLMHRFRYGGLQTQGLYLDETTMRMCCTHRRLFATLALHLIAEKKYEKAKKALAYAEKVLPEYNVPINYLSGGLDLARAYQRLNMKAKAKDVLNKVMGNARQYMDWYLSLDGNRFAQSMQDCALNLYVMREGISILEKVDKAAADRSMRDFIRIVNTYESKGGKIPQ